MELPNRMYEDAQIMLIGSHYLHVWQILNNDIYDYDEKQKEKKVVSRRFSEIILDNNAVLFTESLQLIPFNLFCREKII